MLRNYYNLQLLVKELQGFMDSTITDCFTQEKNLLHIATYEGNVEKVLQFSSDPVLGSFFPRRNFVRSKSNSVNVFYQTLGERIQSIEQIAKQRIIKIETNNFIFFVQLFGGSQNNIFLCNKDLLITGAFKNNNQYINKKYTVPEGNDSIQTENLTAFTFLEKRRFWGKFYARVILSRCNISPNELVHTFEAERLQKILQAEQQLIYELNNTKNFYLYLVDKEFVVSGIPCNEFNLITEFTTISQAFYRCYIETIKFHNFINRKKKLLSEIEKNIKLIEVRIGNQKYLELSQSLVNQYSEWGNILMAQSFPKEKGQEKLKTINFGGEPVVIPLKPELSIIGNAEYFFAKSLKLRNQIETQKKMADLLSPKLEKLKQIHKELLLIEDYSKFEEFIMQIKNELPKLKYESSASPGMKFRRFDIDDGFVLYVGKNARSNDDLTFGFARPNDYWFHARGVSGSHCVLRCPSKREPTKEILQKSAKIAAYYSKGNKAKLVPVAFTQRKYIKKPKGAEPGTVVMMREDVLFVEPKLPEI